MAKEHSVGSIFIDKNHQIVYTIVEVLYYNHFSSGKVFGYKVYRSDKSALDTINNWWLNEYAEKVQ
jgi:hypothetical protein